MPIHAKIETPENAGSQRGAARMRMRVKVPGSLCTGEGAIVVIHDLSATGMLIESKSDLSIGQRLMVVLPEAHELAATIVWRSDSLAGCRFDRAVSRATLSAAQLRNPIPADVRPVFEIEHSETLPHRLQRLRQEHGLSRAALSTRVGVSSPSIWAWETGNTVPRRHNLVLLADAFGVSEQELIAGSGAASRSADKDTTNNQARIQQVVDSSKAQIAEVAGVKAAKVKISIEF